MKIYIVDAFANEACTGNPAAVCMVESERSAYWMQKVANEMNLSETAFLVKEGDQYNLRWFTPESEVDLCGHATLACAHVLWSEENLKSQEIMFNTKSGLISVEAKNDWIHMNFPLEIAKESRIPNGLIEGLGIDSYTFIGRNRLDYIVEVENQTIIEHLLPKYDVLKRVDSRGIIVTSRSDNQEYDFVSRCFFPAVGVNEDPVTGSAHCLLGPYWMNKLDKSILKAQQLSPRRGILHLEVLKERIIISGQAVTTLRGELTVI